MTRIVSQRVPCFGHLQWKLSFVFHKKGLVPTIEAWTCTLSFLAVKQNVHSCLEQQIGSLELVQQKIPEAMAQVCLARGVKCITSQ